MQILNFIDTWLNKTPMYKLVILGLIAIVFTSIIESYFGFLIYSPISLLISLGIILFVTILTNYIFTKIYKLPFQSESTIITALILFLILLPFENISSLISIILASFIAIASKFILTWRNTHIFNPAAIGLFAVTILGFGTAFWWVGSIYLLPIVLIVGLLIIRKVKRTALFVAGIFASLLASVTLAYYFNMNILELLKFSIISGPIIFFLTIMVTEPQTIAKNKLQQIFYALFIILLPLPFQISGIFTMPPELALIIGNIVTLIISERMRFKLKLVRIDKLSEDMYEYFFVNAKNDKYIFNFKAGEYLEWSLDHRNPDFRGLRRYFTITSQPNINEIAFATKFPNEKDSSFKLALKNTKLGDIFYASQLGGDFLLPNSKNVNIIMIAGGIGVTPFISQIRDILASGKKKSVVLFYCVKSPKDIVYKDLLIEAKNKIDLKIICVIRDIEMDFEKNEDFFYEQGYLSKEILQKYTQNLNNHYYISGPNMMVEMLKNNLHALKVSDKNIHTDYFPGF